MNKTIILIGGYGTYALMDVVNKLISNYSNILSINDDSNHPHIIIDNINSSTFTGGEEECAIERNHLEKSINNYSKIYNTKIILAVCCNSITEMFMKVPVIDENIKYINIISSVCKYIKTHITNNKKFHLWSSEYTFTSKNYHNFLGDKYVIELNNNQEVITELITNIKANRKKHIPCDELFRDIENESIIILGCTELPLVKDKLNAYCLENNKNISFIDCNLIYAEQIFKEYNN